MFFFSILSSSKEIWGWSSVPKFSTTKMHILRIFFLKSLKKCPILYFRPTLTPFSRVRACKHPYRKQRPFSPVFLLTHWIPPATPPPSIPLPHNPPYSFDKVAFLQTKGYLKPKRKVCLHISCIFASICIYIYASVC